MPDKAREVRYVEALKFCLAGDFPPGCIVQSESPDFLIVGSASVVGVEVTEFHMPPPAGQQPHQEIQTLKQRIVTLAEERHRRDGGPALYVQVLFDPRRRLYKRNVWAIAERLARSVLSQSTIPNVHQPSLRVPASLLPSEIGRVSLSVSINGEDRLWQPGNAGRVRKIAPEQVQEVIARKSNRAAVAASKCQSLWLVIVHNTLRGGHCELSEAARSAPYEHGFHRVMWLDPHTPHIVRLRNLNDPS